MTKEKQIEDQSEVLYGGRREGGKRFAEMCAKAFENAKAHPENYDDMFAGYENDLNKAVALIEWQKQEIESLTIRMNAFGLAVKRLAEERNERFLLKENGEVVPLTKQSEWISVDERLPTKDEYLTHHKDGLDTLKRITIAYMTDTVEYTIGCYDGYKWMNQLGNKKIKDVVAWKPFETYEPPKMKGGGE